MIDLTTQSKTEYAPRFKELSTNETRELKCPGIENESGRLVESIFRMGCG
jgi:hypothetical protein